MAQNDLYPLFLKLHDQPCLVVGGGAVAAQKVPPLVECGARVTVVSAAFVPSLRQAAARGDITAIERPFQEGDLAAMVLCITATDDAAVNAQVAALCRVRGILHNVVDVPDLCNFFAPAVVSRGQLKIAISTNGCSPALAKRIREELERQFGAEYAEFLEVLGRLRAPVKARYPDQPAERERAFDGLVRSAALDHLRRGDRQRFQALVETWTS